ncbi:MAG: TIGR03546 family protein [Rubripirellula sp.]|jgi:uncharacterized protein (TIGR03546 family)
MIFWIVKLVNSVRRAIEGRKYPHQLAWGIALGLLLGVVPHGNLLAFVLVILVLSLKINHAMAGLTAVCATFLAIKLDPYSHEVGNFILTHPQLQQTTQTAWSLPFIPWTDLNNTIVMGSFLIGLTSVVPVFLITYPIFRLVAPTKASTEKISKTASVPAISTPQTSPHQVFLVDHGHTVPNHSSPPKTASQTASKQSSNAVSKRRAHEPVDFIEIESEPSEEPQVAIETRIDVIRMTDHRGAQEAKATTEAKQSDSEPMDEALNYLLRQLRDSQQRKAA